MGVVQVQHYLSRARDLLKGMDLLKDDLKGYRFSSALLGIHGAIAYCDAIRLGLGSKTLSSDDHETAATDLSRQLSLRRFDMGAGPNRFSRLVGYKSQVAYGESESGLDFGRVVQDAFRFAAWAESTGKKLRIEGWRDE